VEEEHQLDGVRAGELDMALVRVPDGDDAWREGLHCIPLYEERPVVVFGVDHFLAATDQDEEVSEADLAGERPDWPPMSIEDTVATVAAGTGVAVLPMSIARLHARKDVTHRVVGDLPGTTIGLAWRRDRDDERVQAFIGIVRGRTPRSSR
jgi:DNA-binding transcriptional LysR family regulator